MLTSMVKRVDLAVYQAVKDLSANRFTAGDSSMGLKEGGVAMADVSLDFPGKAEALEKVAALKAKIIAGELHVPATTAALEAF
jgi:basic membrane protein A